MNDEFWYLWNDDEAKDDYTDVFEVGKDTDGFTLTLPEGFTVEQAIEQKYGADIVLDQELQADLNYFMIVVTVENSIVRIPFRFSDLTVTLDPPQIVF